MKSTPESGNYLNWKSRNATEKVMVPGAVLKQLGKQKDHSAAKISLRVI